MAFEDRCSPQSAPSPPGMPHSPQNSSSPVAHHHHHHPAYFPNQSTMINQHHHHQHHLQHQSSGTNSPDTPYAPHVHHERLSPLATIKQEELTMDNQQNEAHQQPPIRFSISNILSDNFGKVPKSGKSDKKTSSHLFRPYDIITRDENPVYSEALKQQAVFLEEMRLAQFRIASAHHHNHLQQQQNLHHLESPTILDFSRTSVAPDSTPKAPQPLLFNTFNASSYPKIHDEILNGKHHFNNTISSPYPKIPPLGNLCKTVSQIGQQHHHQPINRPPACRSPSSSVCSSSSSSLSVTPVKQQNAARSTSAKGAKKQQQQPLEREQREVQAIPPPTRESGMDSSDDAKSETSSTKDDGTQLWPAWVYCTRYSDRPSSGE